jgi:multiple sugar transport system substrate-binding protein
LKNKMNIAIALLLTVVLLLSACGGKSAEPAKETETKNETSTNAPDAAPEEKKEPVEFEWMAHTAYSLEGSDPKRVEYLKNKIETFEKEHNAKIKTSTHSGDMAKLFELASQGRAPDVAQIEGFMLPKFYQYLQPLDPYFENAGLKLDDFFPFVQNVMKGPDGKIYGVQFTTDVRVLYYNKELVPTPPKTWDELIAAGKALKDKGLNTLLFPAGLSEATMTTTLLPQFYAQGGKLFDDNGKAVFGEGDNREKMLNVFTTLKTLVDEKITPTQAANIKAEADINADVATGNLAMFLGGNWQVNQLKDLIGAKAFAKWDIAPIPQLKADTNKTTAGGWALGIFTKDPAKQQAAFDFIVETFIGDEGMAKWDSIGGYLPTRNSVYESATYKGNEFTPTFREHLNQFADVRPAADAYQSVSHELQIAVSNVVSGAMTPEQALDTAWKTVNP